MSKKPKQACKCKGSVRSITRSGNCDKCGNPVNKMTEYQKHQAALSDAELKYLAAHGHQCFYCGSLHVGFGCVQKGKQMGCIPDVKPNGVGSIRVRMECPDCGKSWHDVFTLSRVIR